MPRKPFETAVTRAPDGRAGPARGVHVPKIKEFAELQLMDGSSLKGYVFIEVTSRIQDMLNAGSGFFPFMDEQDRIHLINRAAVARLRPYDG